MGEQKSEKEGAMACFRHVLVPVDLSPRSRHVLAEGRRLARACGARLTLIHVASLAAEPEACEELEKRLSRLAGRALGRPRAMHIEVVQGEPAEQILAFAGDNGVDLIVLGQRVRSPLDGLLVYSVSDRVTRRASCSVLIVHEGATRVSPGPPARILCAVDFGQDSEGVLGIAAALARTTRARLTVLHVIDRWRAPSPATFEALDAARNEVADDTYDDLDVLIASVGAYEGDPETLVSLGLVPNQIAGAASVVDADVVVVGARTRRLLGRLLLGPVTRDVLRLARRPVLLARPSATGRPVRVPDDELVSAS